MGGKRNFRNGVGGTYDCIAILSYYAVCKAVTSFREIEENLILPSFRKLKFVDCNKLFWQKLMYKAFLRAKAGCDKWHDYEMTRDVPITTNVYATAARNCAAAFAATTAALYGADGETGRRLNNITSARGNVKGGEAVYISLTFIRSRC